MLCIGRLQDWVDRHRGELTQEQWELLADTPEHGWTYNV
jgi:hypothetical protein